MCPVSNVLVAPALSNWMAVGKEVLIGHSAIVGNNVVIKDGVLIGVSDQTTLLHHSAALFSFEEIGDHWSRR